MKMTRKKILCTVAAIAVVLVGIICMYSVSSAKRAKERAEYDKLLDEAKAEGLSDTSTDTLNINDHLSQGEQTSEESTTEEVTTAATVYELAFESNGNGTCTVTGIGNMTDSCIVIPEKSSEGLVVTCIADNAFYGNNRINTVQIPSTVTSIGNKAFGGCTSLVYISVNGKNTSFKDIDGVLYSRSGDTLIHYPAQKGNEAISIPKSVLKISDMAFYSCSSLKKISFGGSMSDWSKISIGEMNYGLYSASIICADSTQSGK